MLIVRDCALPVADARAALERACARHGFGVLGVHDLGAKLREKGQDFHQACLVVEVCNPAMAAEVLRARPEIAAALPCRVAVQGTPSGSRLSTIAPTVLLDMFDAPEAAGVAQEVERTLVAILEDAVA